MDAEWDRESRSEAMRRLLSAGIRAEKTRLDTLHPNGWKRAHAFLPEYGGTPEGE
jgi:hypothetical protein